MSVDRQREKGAAATVCAGAFLAVVGAFTAWITVDANGFSQSRSGIDWSGDAKVVIVLAVVAALGAIARAAGWKLPGIIVGAVIIDGLIMLALTWYDAAQVSHRGASASGGASVSVGSGLWLSIVGAGAVVVGGYILHGGWRGIWDDLVRLQPTSKADDDVR